MRTFEYRLFVNKKQHHLLMQCLKESRYICNQMLADRLTKAIKRFLAAKANNIPDIGFPRFKKPNRWHSIQLRQYGADGHWYALIVCETEPPAEHEAGACSHRDIGIDVGLKSFLTDSEGNIVENPRFTSQKCHKCGEMVQKSLSVRTHICPFCGYIADGDVNAAQNILKLARPGHAFRS